MYGVRTDDLYDQTSLLQLADRRAVGVISALGSSALVHMFVCTSLASILYSAENNNCIWKGILITFLRLSCH